MDHSIEGKDLLELYAPHHDEPVVTQVSDDDVYKEIVGQAFHAAPETHRRAQVEYRVIVRSRDVNLRAEIPESALREQLDHYRTLRMTPVEGDSLRSMSAMEDGVRRNIFTGEYVDFRERMVLPDYDLRLLDDGYDLRFPGPAEEVMHWEIAPLMIISELRYFHLVKRANLTRFERDLILGHYMRRCWERSEILRTEPRAGVTDFGSRRRNSKRAQWFWNHLLQERNPGQYRGTSNMALAREMGSSNPIGTVGHEGPMLWTAIARILSGGDPQAMRQAVIEFFHFFFAMYPAAMRILLPDTYTSATFYRDADRRLAELCAGFRLDSAPPAVGIPQFARWIQSHGLDPMSKLGITSDGNDAEDVVHIYRTFISILGRISSAIGTFGTNGFDRMPEGLLALVPGFKPMSIVNKLWSVALANDPSSRVSAVKTSDNRTKATGDPAEVAFYEQAFDMGEIAENEVFV